MKVSTSLLWLIYIREYYFPDNDVITIRDMHCTYNGVGSLTSDKGRGIALIEYDDMNYPKAKCLFALTGRNPLKSF